MRQAAADDPRIRFVGYVTGEAKQALLASAHHLLIPSLWYENAPVAVIEAAAYGLGVIASRIGGLPELVREGRTGLLFEPGDAAGLAAIMHGLLDGRLVLPDLAEESRAIWQMNTRLSAWSMPISRNTRTCWHYTKHTRAERPARLNVRHRSEFRIGLPAGCRHGSASRMRL